MIPKIVFCQIAAAYDMEKALENVKLVKPFVDGTIVCYSELRLQKEFEELGTVLVQSKASDNFPAHRNCYLEKAKELNYDYVLTCDADEKFDQTFLAMVKSIPVLIPTFNGYEILCKYNIINEELMDKDEIFRERPGGPDSNWWKLVLFKLEPNMRYVGGSRPSGKVHETLIGADWRTIKLPRKYFMTQTKSAEQIWRNNARNVFIGGGGNDVGELNPVHKTIKSIFNGTWSDFYNKSIQGIFYDEIKQSLIENSNGDEDYHSENKGFLKWYLSLSGLSITFKNELKMTTERYVKQCYFDILHRHPDAHGLEFYTKSINNGQINKEDLPKILMDSDEYLANYINTLFFDYALRVPPLREVELYKTLIRSGSIANVENFIRTMLLHYQVTTIAYCQMIYKKDLDMAIENINNAKEYVDYCIVIYDQSLDDSDIKKLKDSGAIARYYKWEDNFPKQRNNYILESLYLGVKWILVSDPDEHFDINFLKNVREICRRAEISNIDLLQINSHDVYTDDEEGNVLKQPNEVVSDYYKNLLFRASPTILYTGVGETKNLHENLVGAKSFVALPKEYFYRHIKSHVEIWRHSCRNIFVGGGGMNLGYKIPHYKDFEMIVKQKLGIKTANEFISYLEKGNIDEELKEFIIKHRNDNGHDYDSEYREMFKYYFQVLHPEENVNNLKVESKQFVKYQGLDADINNVYLKILKREVDYDGLTNYSKLIQENKISLNDLERILLNSEEYRRKT